MLDTTIAILAGGEGSRMGRPKAELRIGGEPILRHLLKRLGWRGPTLLVTAPGREHPPAWQDFDREVSDPVAGEGPLRGVLTALQNSTTPLVAVATVDMPMIGCEHLTVLLTILNARAELIGAMCARSTVIEPFPCAFRRSRAEVLVAAQHARGNRSVSALARESPLVAAIDAPADWDPRVWTNLNRPEDLDNLANDPSLPAD
jgi:molybdopterin-guanine dinucleotide biosynthesis protein A